MKDIFYYFVYPASYFDTQKYSFKFKEYYFIFLEFEALFLTPKTIL